MTTDELVAIQTEIKGLTDEFNVYYTDRLGAKVGFLKLAEKLTWNVVASSQVLRLYQPRVWTGIEEMFVEFAILQVPEVSPISSAT